MYFHMDGRSWFLLFMIVLYGATLVLHFRQTKSLRKKIEQIKEQAKEERGISRIQSRRKNYAGQIFNLINKWRDGVDPDEKIYALFRADDHSQVDIRAKSSPWDMRLQVSFYLLNGERSIVLEIHYNGARLELLTFPDSQGGLNKAKSHISDFLARCVSTSI